MMTLPFEMASQAAKVTGQVWAQQIAVWQVMTTAAVQQQQAFLGLGPSVWSSAVPGGMGSVCGPFGAQATKPATKKAAAPKRGTKSNSGPRSKSASKSGAKLTTVGGKGTA